MRVACGMGWHSCSNCRAFKGNENKKKSYVHLNFQFKKPTGTSEMAEQGNVLIPQADEPEFDP